MSFSADVKTEICKIKPTRCCAYAQLYGILLLSRSFSNMDVFYSSDRQDVAERCSSLISSEYHFKPDFIEDKGNFGLKSDIIHVGELYADFITVDYITDVFGCDACFSAFLRGAFLSGGTVTDPNKDFHLELKTVNEAVAISIHALLVTEGFKAHISKRGKYHLVYFKGNESVSDFLALIGASKKALEVIDAGMIKEMRNRVNRAKNCETGNIGKTVNAMIKQVNAINKLKQSGRLNNLSEELQYAAKLRLDNPEMSLTELSKLCGVSRSGLNHRLNRLIELSDDK